MHPLSSSLSPPESGSRWTDRGHRERQRPTFAAAAPPDEAEPVYERFCQELRDLGVPVATGVFGASMQLELVNDGPVTIVL